MSFNFFRSPKNLYRCAMVTYTLKVYLSSSYVGDCGDINSIFEFCIYLCGNLVTWHNKN